MIELMKNSGILAQMSFGEKMTGCLTVTLLGLGTCFVVLVVLMTTITLLKKSAAKKEGGSKAAAPAAPAPAPVQAAPVQDDTIDPAVVAAIAGVLAKRKGGKKFRIVNIAPAEDKNAWTTEGRSQAFASRGSRL